MVPELRKESILKSIKNKEISYMKDLASELGISLSTVRRDVALLEQEGAVTVMRGGAVKYKVEDFDAPVIKKKLIHSDEKERIARRAAAFVEDGDSIYVDSGTTTVGMFKYLQGKRITVVSSSTELLENLPIKNAKCILLGGEVREDLQSVMGAQTEKMISDMYFDKAFIGANGYIPDGGVYTYDDREARKKQIVKEHAKVTYILMDTSKKNKYAFSKAFELNEGILITEEDGNPPFG